MPSGILIERDYGDMRLNDIFKPNVFGSHLVVSARPEVLINWLSNFNEVWVSEDLNPEQPFNLASIKENIKRKDIIR